MLNLLLTIAAVTPVQDGDSFWDKFEGYGDFRLRHESTFDHLTDTTDPADGTFDVADDRHRERVRVRVGGRYAWNPDTWTELRLTTASANGDANSPHWDFGDDGDSEGLNGIPVEFDRVNLGWNVTDALTVQVGKFGHVFATNPVYGSLAWDSDIQPSGLSAVWTADGALDFDIRLAEYRAVENATGSDASMFGAQANLGLGIGSGMNLGLSSSWTNWRGLAAGGTSVGDPQGVTATDGSNGGFAILDTTASISLDGGPWDTTVLSVQYMNNLDDDLNEDTGMAFGALLGTSGYEGAWNTFLVRYDLDANAVFGPVAQDDTPFAGTGTGTGMSGLIAGFRYWCTDATELKLWALTSDADEVLGDPLRVRFEVNMRF